MITDFSYIPLAWANLTHDKRRCAISILGVGFAVMLIFIQFGFWNGLLDSSCLVIDELNADLVVISKARYALTVRERFTIHRLTQAQALPEVLDTVPLYVEAHGTLWRDTEDGPIRFLQGEASTRPIRVIAFNPAYPALRSPEVRRQLPLLRLPDTLLLDRLSKPDFGRRASGMERELAGHEVHVIGTFDLGTDFTNDGTLLMSDVTYARLFAGRLSRAAPLGMADLGLVALRPGAAPAAVRDRLNALLPDDVQVMTIPEFAASERLYWQLTTPVGLIFTIGLVMGCIVGTVICFQILSADVADHLKEYATLKAIGYHDQYLNRMILAESLWLTLFGFGPALLITLVAYRVLSDLTGLPLYLTVARCALVLALTAASCVVSGLLALGKLRSADPAEVFS